MRSRLPAVATARMARTARIQNRAPRELADPSIPMKAAMAAAQKMPRSRFTCVNLLAHGTSASALRVPRPYLRPASC